MRLFRTFAILGLAAVVGGCGPPAPGSPRPPHLRRDQLSGPDALPAAELARLARAPTRDFRQRLSIALRDGVSGKGFDGRGALAVRPGHALRMVLLGPGGTTAMDVWIGEGRWRVAIPAIDRVVRGDATTPPERMRGLPIALLSRWLVAPFAGQVMALHRGRTSSSGEVIDAANDPMEPSTSMTRPGFVAFLRRGTTFEVRARSGVAGGFDARAWWLDRGQVTSFLIGEERAIGDGPEAPVIPVQATWTLLDPAMTVRVHAEQVEVVPADAPLPDVTFADPG